MKPLRVLYLHFYGPFGGASRSLYETVRSFEPGAVEPLFLTQRGNVTDFFSQLGEVLEARGLSQFENTRYGHYRGVRWIVLLREIALLPTTVLALRQAYKRWGQVDGIHSNEFCGLIAIRIARWWFKAPAVTHVRSVLRNDVSSRRTRWMHHKFRNDLQGVVAIDENVRASLPADLPVEVIHNGFTSKPPKERDARLAQRLAALRPESFKVGFVGNLLRVKGIHELVEAARLLGERGIDAEFLIIGDDARPSRGLKAWLLARMGLQQNVRAEVEGAIEQLNLRDRFHLLGFTRDVGLAYEHMDVLTFPSHYDAPGRPIFEAAFSGKPSIVAVRDPRPDTLVDGITGIAIEPREARQLADAIEKLARDPALAQRMGQAALAMATHNFDAKSNAARLLALYRRTFKRPGDV